MNIELMLTAIVHTVYGQLRRLAPIDADRDRGAVSLEQVLWFVAAGVAVAVIAGILWARSRPKPTSPSRRRLLPESTGERRR